MSEPSNYGCEQPGCLAHVSLGDAIHRTSPMGGPFRGKCTKHFREDGGEPDEIAVLIEEASHPPPTPEDR